MLTLYRQEVRACVRPCSVLRCVCCVHRRGQTQEFGHKSSRFFYANVSFLLLQSTVYQGRGNYYGVLPENHCWGSVQVLFSSWILGRMIVPCCRWRWQYGYRHTEGSRLSTCTCSFPTVGIPVVHIPSAPSLPRRRRCAQQAGPSPQVHAQKKARLSLLVGRARFDGADADGVSATVGALDRDREEQ